MIPFASQRGGGQDLATHLLNAHDNELTELVDMRGAVADDLHGAFKEWEVQAQSLTRCDKYLYSLSINPDPSQPPLSRDQYMDYIRRTEDTLGLSDQPRAIVFHTKYGREHCHVVWSRIDAENKRAVHLAFDRDKLMRVTRGFARDHGIALPEGYDKSRQAGQITLYEQEQLRQTGLSKEDHIREVTDAWRQSDDAKSFVQALAERGYILATGKRPYVLVDLYGNMNALPKLIDDKSVRTNDLRKFLEQDFPAESLPTVDEARALVAAHRALIEKSVDDNELAEPLAVLKHAQQERRQEAVQALAGLKVHHEKLRHTEFSRHRQERDDLRTLQRQQLQTIRQQRYDNRPTGLAAFLGKITGVAFVQRVKARRDDARLVKAYVERKTGLKDKQRVETSALDLRLTLQRQTAEQKIKALEKVESRELASLMRDAKGQQRTRSRGESGMPSLAHIFDVPNTVQNGGELTKAFGQASDFEPAEIPDVQTAFSNAASGIARLSRSGETGQTPVAEKDTPHPEPDRDQER